MSAAGRAYRRKLLGGPIRSAYGLVVFLLVFGSLVSCGTSLKLPSPDYVTGAKPLGSDTPSETINARIFVDGTSSMRGYAGTTVRSDQPPQPSAVAPKAAAPANAPPLAEPSPTFIGFIQRFEQVLSFGWKKSTTECYQFGAQVHKTAGAHCYVTATVPSFYNLPRPQDLTHIDQVLVYQRSADNLDVIVTDLYQDEADLGALFQGLKEHVFNKNFSLGLIALKSRFDGMVYDIGLDKLACTYHGDRPVYALVIGTRANVLRYFEELVKPPGGFSRDRLLLLSSDLLSAPMEWKTSSRTLPKGLAENMNSLFVSAPEHSWSFGVISVRDSPSGSSVRLHFSMQRAAFHPLVNWSRLPNPNVHVRLFRFNSTGRDFKEITGASVMQANLVPPEKENDGPSVDVKFENSFPSDYPYLAEIRPVFDASSVDFPQFVSDWSSPMTSTNGCKGFSGQKTQNLKEFVSGGWRTFVEQEPPQLGPIYIYFKK